MITGHYDLNEMKFGSVWLHRNVIWKCVEGNEDISLQPVNDGAVCRNDPDWYCRHFAVFIDPKRLSSRGIVYLIKPSLFDRTEGFPPFVYKGG